MGDQHGPQPQRCALLTQHRRHTEKAHAQTNRPRQKAAPSQCQSDFFRQRRTLHVRLQLRNTHKEITDSSLFPGASI